MKRKGSVNKQNEEEVPLSNDLFQTTPIAAGTLADASGRNIEHVVNKIKKRRKESKSSQPTITNNDLLPSLRKTSRFTTNDTTCGAPAAQIASDEPFKPTNDAATSTKQDDIQQPLDDNDNDLWEDIVHEEDITTTTTHDTNQDKNTNNDGTLIIDVHTLQSKQQKTKRQTFTKEDRHTAELIHRCHLLCLVSRGLLFDAAANDAMIQSVLLSILPSSPLSTTTEDHHHNNNNTSTSMKERGLHGCSMDVLMDTMNWFRSKFTLLPQSLVASVAVNNNKKKQSNDMIEEISLLNDDDDEDDGSIIGGNGSNNNKNKKINTSTTTTTNTNTTNSNGGIDECIQLLLNAIQTSRGTSEQLTALFAASLRAQGYLARIVHIMEPSSIKPSEALKQQEALAMRIAMEEESKNNGGGSSSSVGVPLVELFDNSSNTTTNDNNNNNGDGDDDVKGKLSKKKRKKSATPQPQEQQDNTTTNTTNNNKKKKTRADEEYELQMAMAIAATSFDATTTDNDNTLINNNNNDNEDIKKKNKKKMMAALFKNNKNTTTNNTNTNNTNNKQHIPSQLYHDLFTSWVEVYCCHDTTNTTNINTNNNNNDGRWVHVDPLLGLIDRATEVYSMKQMYSKKKVNNSSSGSKKIASPSSTTTTNTSNNNNMMYVVAFAGGGAKDVTARYRPGLSFSADRQKAVGEWWDATLRPLRRKELAAMHHNSMNTTTITNGADDVSQKQDIKIKERINTQYNTSNTNTSHHHNNNKIGKNSLLASLAAAKEDEELTTQIKAQQEALPTTIDGFKSHPLYILQRHIGKYQVMHPDAKPIGLHRGEAYYLRKYVCEIHTAERWMREGREVLPEQIGQPVKKIKKRRIPGSSSSDQKSLSMMIDDDNDDDIDGIDGDSNTNNNKELLSDFYGIWQTRERAPLVVVNGKIPKNERGNVEVPPFAASLPIGAIHIDMPYAAAACKKLGIDFAPALTGFDLKRGRSVPVIAGVVVCTEHEEAVRAACEEELAQRAQRAKEKRLALGEQGWRQLLRAVMMKVTLKRSYGESRGTGADAEGEAGALLVDSQRGGGSGSNRGGRKKRGGNTGGRSGGSGRSGVEEEEKKEEINAADMLLDDDEIEEI